MLDFDQQAIIEDIQGGADYASERLDDRVEEAGERFDVDKQFENTENPEEEK